MDLGRHIRKQRLLQGRTLDQVAADSRCSKSLLSKIENSRTTPPIATLTRIARALGVPMAALLEDSHTASTVYTPADAVKPADFITTAAGYAFYPVAAGRTRKVMQPYLFRVEKRKLKEHALAHAGEEFMYMLQGEMKFRVGSIEYRLRPGDSIYFDGLEEHELRLVSDRVEYIGIFTESQPSGSGPAIKNNQKKKTLSGKDSGC
jgi:transcriptional regulator with XRE-family HTH domain